MNAVIPSALTGGWTQTQLDVQQYCIHRPVCIMILQVTQVLGARVRLHRAGEDTVTYEHDLLITSLNACLPSPIDTDRSRFSS